MLATTNRELNFRVTVRDNVFGGFGMDSMKLNVVDTGAGFAVTSPNTVVTYAGGNTQTVTWNVAGTTASPINAANVNILLTLDATPASGDPAFPIVLAANTPNDGSESVTLPNIATSKARIMVQAAGNVFFDVSDANFTITSNAPTLANAVSRKTHGAAGDFDISLPSFGTPGVECRRSNANGDYRLVFTFGSPLTNGNASITGGTATISNSGIGTDAHEYIVNLSGVTNNQTVTVSLNVTDANGTGMVSVPMRVLLGDTNGDGAVNSADATQTRNRSGQTTGATNFRSDVNVDGTVNSGDAAIVRANSGSGI